MGSYQQLGAQLASHQIANTYGWDTVSAVRVGSMNRTIERTAASPKGFSLIDEEQNFGVRADFGHWRIGNGGDGRLVQMELPLRQVEAWYGKQTYSGEATAVIQVELQFLPQPLLQQRRSPGEDPGLPNKLVIADRKVVKSGGLLTAVRSDDTPVASVLSLLGGGGELLEISPYLRAVIKQSLQDWLGENLDEFSHVFATVNLFTNGSGQSAFEWLKPSHATYHFHADANDPDSGVFAILCKTGGRSPVDLAEQLSPFAIPNGADAAFLISPERMLEDMVAPSLPAVFNGLTNKQLTFDEDELLLQAKTDVQLKQIEHEGEKFDAKLETLNIKLRDREMIMETQCSTKVSPGIYSVCQSTGYYNIGMVTKESGEQTLGYRSSRASEFHDWTKKDPGIKILQSILSVISIVAGVLAFVPGVNGVAIPVLIIAALVSGGGVLTMKLIEAIHTDDAPALDLLITNATKAVTWANGDEFELTSAELNGSLQLAGNFKGPVLRL